MSGISIDATGLLCPLPVLKLRKALMAAETGEVVELTATDPAAAIDVPHFCQETGNRLLDRAAGAEPGATVYRVQKI